MSDVLAAHPLHLSGALGAVSRRRRQTEPMRCVCRPGPNAHHEHAKPGKHVAQHFDPRCPHWDPASSGLPLVQLDGRVRLAPIRRVTLDE